ncbi:early transcription factor VETFL-like protein [Seal parapoxvirus]|uniref:Early transcription factor 82 kDa subunit n=1 Tax=Seal parapoxvirus TaxID=187984 RepID=A0A1Z3GCR8_9POXV|nr:early transcription factor VETFL-like protein [Seal parapoxvirus]ASC55558.1 early transcription factor VETFL-like protein [Seal parapoxvirus]
MLYTVSPQLVVLVGPRQEIQRVLYLSLYDHIDESSPIYFFAKQYIQHDPEHVRRHILLTMRVRQLKGYLGHLLDLQDDIIVYSHKNNLEYSYVDNTIFTPFSPTQKKTLIRTDGILYNAYADACDFLVVWVARAADTAAPEFGSFEEPSDSILKFEERLIREFENLDLNMTVETKFNNIFRTNLRESGLRAIAQQSPEKQAEVGHFDILLSKTDDFFISMTGTRFLVVDEPLNLLVWSEDGAVAISSDGKTLTVNNVGLFTKLVASMDVKMDRIKGDITYKVSLATHITSKMKLDMETSFMFVETATNNILLSTDKRISIILAKSHVSVKVKNYIPNIEKYFTFLIVAISVMFNSVKQSSDFTKVETVYWSRICQNTKTKNRKPVIVQSLEANMRKVGNNFYRSDAREVFVNDNGIMFSCMDPDGRYNSVGFLSIFHRLQRICIPCCFLRSQAHTDTFKSCVYNEEVDRSSLNPYILNFGKVVTESKLSFLPIIFDKFFNEGLEADFEADNKRLRSTTGYHVVHCCEGAIVRLRSVSEIVTYVNESSNILISGDMVYFPMQLTDASSTRILIQEIVHDVACVRKDAAFDAITISPSSTSRLASMFPHRTDNRVIREEAGLSLTTTGFFVDGHRFEPKLSSRFTAFVRNITVPNAVSRHFARLFRYVVTDAPERFIKTWSINCALRLSVEPDSSRAPALLQEFFPQQ